MVQLKFPEGNGNRVTLRCRSSPHTQDFWGPGHSFLRQFTVPWVDPMATVKRVVNPRRQRPSQLCCLPCSPDAHLPCGVLLRLMFLEHNLGKNSGLPHAPLQVFRVSNARPVAASQLTECIVTGSARPGHCITCRTALRYCISTHFS